MKFNLKDLNPGSWFYFDEKNPADGRICIRVLNSKKLAEIRDKTVKTEIEIISKDKKVIDYEIIRQKDENLAKGKELVAQEGVNGYEIKTYRIIKQDGTEKIELLSSDIYKSVPMIIKEN